MKFCSKTSFTVSKQSQSLDPSYKMEVGFWDCFRTKNFCLITEEIRY